ncbi:MAG: Fe-S cluster domain-containing protein [Dysgonamonadaceae bacterium]|jgi:Na+-translocating ferredoxin:NAD+ oxidoreductase RNF subunit RnfB|nr:Fe-S cluster domain-containing protein [Dysgonamonadaceae bacterium]
MNTILLSVIILGGIGFLGVLILYFASKKFEVYEDSRIIQIQNILPAANCGACGFPGCSGFAAATVKSSSLDGLHCPVGGNAVMTRIAETLGQNVSQVMQQIAVVRCNGSCENRRRINKYDGEKTCFIASGLYGGETPCSFGCLGYGDCTKVCSFDAIRMNDETRLPEIDEEKCTACGKCIKACPKLLIELRKQGPKSRRIYVSCVNKDKPAVAMKACKVSCISCKKCEKVCSFEAIIIENNLAYIDDNKCRLCRKCVSECPNYAIKELNFPIKKEKVENI